MVQPVAIKIDPLKAEQLDTVIALDRLSLGGMWTREKYLQELSWTNSTLLVIESLPRITSKNAKQLAKILGLGGWRVIGHSPRFANAKEARITILVIHPQYQSQGLGQLLFLQLLIKIRNQGINRVRLEVRVSNQPAIALYQQFGLQIVQKIPNYYQKPSEDGFMLYCDGLNKPQFQQKILHWQQKIASKLEQYGFSYQ